MINRSRFDSRGLRSALYALMVVVYLLFPMQSALANNIQVTNLVVHPHNSGNGEVEFDLSWGNSWRVATEPYNWDAAWVFCKIRRNGGDWTHLKLDTTGHTIPQSPQAITTAMGLVDPTIAHNASTNPAVGMFVYRTNDGFGTFTANDVRLRWNYSDNGASSSDVIEIRVIAIEMVYIPEGAFYAGDGSPDETGTTSRLKQGSSDIDPWYITSEDAMSVTNASSDGFYYVGLNRTGESATGSTFTVDATFPKGYGAFYMMKGEISQGQYVTFFNTLTNTQKAERDITASHITYGGKNSDSIVNRNNISWTSGDAVLIGGTHSGVAMTYLAWADIAAILDWSGLRPMTELEYEKAGRGSRGPSSPVAAVSGEYAWGNTTLSGATSLTDAGLASERGQVGSNVIWGQRSGIGGPVRVGSFAKGVNTRVASGAGFYGVMELTGNAEERCISVGMSAGRTFQGRYHGDGVLDTNGDANTTTWPGTDALGAGGRGSSWGSGAYNNFRLSNRTRASITVANRQSDFGGRGVRSAP